MPKILVLDIEWKPTQAYVWRPFKENIGFDQIIEHGGLLCVGYQWFGAKGKPSVLTEWDLGHEEMVRQTHELLNEADAVVTYNGDKYDLRKLEGEFLLQELPPVQPTTSIDLLKTVKKMGYFMNRLGFIGPFLGLGAKVEHEGIRLWHKVMNGNRDAQKRMKGYCAQDVTVTVNLYKKLRPYIRNHPRLKITERDECPACSSKQTQRRGWRFTRCFRIRRLQCTSCGHWFDGERNKIGA